jgi:hypothetical protein
MMIQIDLFDSSELTVALHSNCLLKAYFPTISIKILFISLAIVFDEDPNNLEIASLFVHHQQVRKWVSFSQGNIQYPLDGTCCKIV